MVKRTVAFHSLGCKVNHYEANSLRALFLAQGYEQVDFSDCADVYVINTCAVTKQAASKSRQLMRQARRHNPEAKIVMVGCYVQVTAKEIAEGVFSEADLLIGSSEKSSIVVAVEKLFADDQVGRLNLKRDYDQLRQYEQLPDTLENDRVRAEIKVQDGCEQFCSYCIIPYARGPERSRPLANVIAEINNAVGAGFKEIVLTGIHLGHYGRDLAGDIDLSFLVQQVLDKTAVSRLRLSSIEPNDVSDNILSLFASPRLARHLHIPLQSGCDKTLKNMSRQYTTADYRQLLDKIKAKVPDMAITTDIIVGFPGEDDADFEETCAFVREMNFSRMHVFRYSRRPGTPAATFPHQVPKALGMQRSKIMHQIAAQMQACFYQTLLGQTLRVLFEQEVAAGVWEGHAGNYAVVRVKSQDNLRNCFADVKIVKEKVNYVLGNVI